MDESKKISAVMFYTFFLKNSKGCQN